MGVFRECSRKGVWCWGIVGNFAGGLVIFLLILHCVLQHYNLNFENMKYVKQQKLNKV